ncbi:GntR family transcriptional regulator [Sinomonas sp. G460-2]|uniref:GntR family transcriptional regulator n=1 Tax=Sinomonas sp. G460-2 TaxID=3393464 RepID=UPI0039EF03CA
MATSVYRKIREAILSGRFPPEHLLGENALASEFNISRTPVREALHRLEIERLVERTARGMIVRATSPEEILDIYDVRITLEGAAAHHAALRATELDRIRLRSAQDAMAKADADVGRRQSTNRDFHAALWHASHSATLLDLLERLNTHLIRYSSTTLTDNERWEAALGEHEELLAAIEAQDPEKAQRLAIRHMKGARDVRLRMYAEGQGSG